jgi:hypothetical protein
VYLYIYCIIDFLYCSNCNPLFILSCFLTLIVSVPIYFIIDFLYCSNCNPLFILSCFFHICNITSCCTFSCVRVTNKILLLTSGRITVITDDDMFLTRQLLDSYTSYNLISIVFQMCKNYVFNIVPQM